MFDPKRLKPDDNGHMWAQTRDGRRVRVLCTDGPSRSWPVYGIVDGREFVDRWALNGRVIVDNNDITGRDLMNLPEPPREIEAWAVVNRNGIHLTTWSTLIAAKLACRDGQTIVRLTGTWEPSDA